MAGRVAVGLSGGVDSAVAAALLKAEGYEVIGVMLRLWGDAAEDDARRVAQTLGIPFHVLDFRDCFRREVVDYFADEYRRGRTPNPCVVCNRRVKFGELLAWAEKAGAQYIATGHYARVEQHNGRYVLRRCASADKDQTYVLYGLSQEQLARTLMPLGTYDKDAVRALAKELALPVADKPDSQDICFIPDGDYMRFLREFAGYQGTPGSFLDMQGNVIGRHDGVARFTIGQRKGLGMTFGRPMFVVDIDAATGDVTLGEAGTEYADGLVAEGMNFLPFEHLEDTLHCTCKTRYRSKETPCTVEPLGDGRVHVRFERPERAVTPGQSVVLYDGDMVLGGGIIARRDS